MKEIDHPEQLALEQWHLVWNWWPVPAFLLPLLGRSGCDDLVRELNERQMPHRLLISFALALEHRRLPICSITELESRLVSICATDYDFSAADALQRAVSDLRWSRLRQEIHAAMHRVPTPDSREALEEALALKQLPAGPEANLALIREILQPRQQCGWQGSIETPGRAERT